MLNVNINEWLSRDIKLLEQLNITHHQHYWSSEND